MLKMHDSMKEQEFETRAVDALRDLLGQVSVIKLKEDIKLAPSGPDPGVDFISQLKISREATHAHWPVHEQRPATPRPNCPASVAQLCFQARKEHDADSYRAVSIPRRAGFVPRA